MKLRWLLSGLIGFFLLCSPAEAAKLRFWRFDPSINRLDFRTDDGVQPKAQLIFNPTRLVIDLPRTSLERATVRRQVPGAAIQSVRVGQFDDYTTRIVIELAPGYSIDPQQVRFVGTSPRYWTVQLPTPQLVASIGGDQPADSILNPAPSTPIPVPPPENNLPVETPRIRKTGVLVMIDPGHGGQDVGAIGVGGIHEADIVLAISQQVARLLQQQGIQVVMTRDSDYFVDLAPRVEMAKRMDADLFVSIHANSINNRPDVNGLEVYHYGNGERLAWTIRESILQSIGIRDRGVRRARFYVLRNNPMPAVLVETGYVSHSVEGRRLADPAYQNQMAAAIARGILQYLRGR